MPAAAGIATASGSSARDRTLLGRAGPARPRARCSTARDGSSAHRLKANRFAIKTIATHDRTYWTTGIFNAYFGKNSSQQASSSLNSVNLSIAPFFPVLMELKQLPAPQRSMACVAPANRWPPCSSKHAGSCIGWRGTGQGVRGGTTCGKGPGW
jgi:hypothetical protein